MTLLQIKWQKKHTVYLLYLLNQGHMRGRAKFGSRKIGSVPEDLGADHIWICTVYDRIYG